MTDELIIKDLHVSVEGQRILNGVDLVIRKGQVCALMGPNGSGKCIALYDKVIVNNRLMSGYELSKQIQDVESEYHQGGLLFKKKLLIYTPQGSVKESIPYIEPYAGLGYLIKTKSGREITVTPEHKLLIFSHKMGWSESKNLKEGTL